MLNYAKEWLPEEYDHLIKKVEDAGERWDELSQDELTEINNLISKLITVAQGYHEYACIDH